MGNFGPAEMLFIGVFALLIFGPQKLPEIARSIGNAIREFKKVSGEFTKELQLEMEEEASKAPELPKPGPAEPRPGPK